MWSCCCVVGAIAEWVCVGGPATVSLVIYEKVEFWMLWNIRWFAESDESDTGPILPKVAALQLLLQPRALQSRSCFHEAHKLLSAMAETGNKDTTFPRLTLAKANISLPSFKFGYLPTVWSIGGASSIDARNIAFV